MKYEEWLYAWLGNYIKPSAKQRTYNTYLKITKKRIIPKLGGYELDELSPTVIQEFITELLNDGNTLTSEGLSVNTVNLIITIIQSSLKTAFVVGKANEYTANKVKRPRSRQQNVSCFTVAEQKKIEQAVRADCRSKMLGVIICLYTGLRIGELLSLTWEDVNFQKNYLIINKTCQDGRSKDGLEQITNEPKTEASKRIIPIPKQIFCILKELKRRERSNYVISANGMPVTIRSYQRSFALLLEKLNIPHKGFHSLRHTFATRALECGMDVKTLSEILGHKNATLTLNRYAHSLYEHKANMMNKLGALFLQ